MSQHVDTFTIGVEEEFQIIDPRTRALSSDVERIYPIAHSLLGDAVQYELILSQLEIATPICQTLAEVRRSLSHLRQGIIQAAETAGRQVAAGGTHPFSAGNEQLITPKERYQQLVQVYQQLIREQVIFGCHVHIGVPDRDVAARVISHARLWLAPLLALAANSPFWNHVDTGYASYRSGLWWTVPLSGPPPYFHSLQEYDAMIKTLIETGSMQEASHLYWDIRLSDRFKTIEFRVMDVCLTVREATLMAGLVRGLVRQCYEYAQTHLDVPEVSTELLRAASWRAARYGLTDELFDPQQRRLAPAREVIRQFLQFIRPALEAEGDWSEVSEEVQRLLRIGNGATRQRAVYQKHGQLTDVVDFIVSETRSY